MGVKAPWKQEKSSQPCSEGLTLSSRASSLSVPLRRLFSGTCRQMKRLADGTGSRRGGERLGSGSRASRVLLTLGQYVPLHHPHTPAGAVGSVADGREAPVEAGRSSSKGLLAPLEQLQRVGRLLLWQTDSLSSRARPSLQTRAHLAQVRIQVGRERRGHGHRAGQPAGSSAHRTHC